MISQGKLTVPIIENVPFAFHWTFQNLLWYKTLDIGFWRISPFQVSCICTSLNVFDFVKVMVYDLCAVSNVPFQDTCFVPQSDTCLSIFQQCWWLLDYKLLMVISKNLQSITVLWNTGDLRQKCETILKKVDNSSLRTKVQVQLIFLHRVNQDHTMDLRCRKEGVI